MRKALKRALLAFLVAAVVQTEDGSRSQE